MFNKHVNKLKLFFSFLFFCKLMKVRYYVCQPVCLLVSQLLCLRTCIPKKFLFLFFSSISSIDELDLDKLHFTSPRNIFSLSHKSFDFLYEAKDLSTLQLSTFCKIGKQVNLKLQLVTFSIKDLYRTRINNGSKCNIYLILICLSLSLSLFW